MIFNVTIKHDDPHAHKKLLEDIDALAARYEGDGTAAEDDFRAQYGTIQYRDIPEQDIKTGLYKMHKISEQDNAQKPGGVIVPFGKPQPQ